MEDKDSGVFISRPPTNVKVRRDARAIDNLTPEAFLRQLKRAFNLATNNKEEMNIDQWMVSDLNAFVSNNKMKSEEYKQYFNKIDACKKGTITWNDISMYLICETGPVEKKSTTNQKIIRKVEASSQVMKNAHRELITEIKIIKWLDIMVTLSRDVIKFWKMDPLKCVNTLKNEEEFCASCCFNNSQIMAIALASRNIIFMNTEEMTKIPAVISSSITNDALKKMSLQETKDALRDTFKKDTPLLHEITLLIEETLSPRKKFVHSLVVADYGGEVAVFSLHVPERRHIDNYTTSFICKIKAHNDKITDIKAIPDIGVYATSSLDGSLRFISFNDNKLQITKTFQEVHPISSFTYFQQKRFLCMTLCGAAPTVWAMHPQRKLQTITSQYKNPFKCFNYKPLQGPELFATVTSTCEIRFFNSNSFIFHSEYITPDDTRNVYNKDISAATYDPETSTIYCASHYPIALESVQQKNAEETSHLTQISNLWYTEDFKKIVTIDESCVINICNFEDGEIEKSHKINTEKIKFSCMDTSGRRVFTCSSPKGDIDVWNYNSGGYLETITRHENQSMTSMLYGSTKSRKFIAYSAGNKLHLILEEKPGRFDETADISIGIKSISCVQWDQSIESFIIGSNSGDVCLIPFDPNSPNIKVVLPDHPKITSIFISPKSYAFVVTDDQMIFVLSLPTLHLELRTPGLNISVSYQITCADSNCGKVVTGDSNGYVNIWQLYKNTLVKFNSLRLLRCHNSEIRKIKIIPNSNYFVTAGSDLMVRVWSFDTFECVGSFTNSSTWIIGDSSTWSKEQVAELDSYVNAIKPNPSKALKTIRSSMLSHRISSGLSLAHMSGKEEGRNKFKYEKTNECSEEEEEIKERPFDLAKTYDVITNFFDHNDQEIIVDSLQIDKKYPLKEQKNDKILEFVLNRNRTRDFREISENIKEKESGSTSRIQKCVGMIVKPSLTRRRSDFIH